jgi:hypothetical protein
MRTQRDAHGCCQRIHWEMHKDVAKGEHMVSSTWLWSRGGHMEMHKAAGEGGFKGTVNEAIAKGGMKGLRTRLFLKENSRGL